MGSEMSHRKMRCFMLSAIVGLLFKSPFAFALDTAVHLPDQYRSDSQWPLVILLHGSGASGDMQDLHLGISSRVSKKGMILAVPEARSTAGSGITSNEQMIALIEKLKSDFSVDPSRIYLIGHSMGGYQSLRFACEHGDKIAGMVISAASGVCLTSSFPVNFLLATGDADISDTNVELSLASWRRVNGCHGEPKVSVGLDLHWEIHGDETKRLEWSDCSDGSKIVSLRSQFGRHVPIFKAAFADQALDFLLGTSTVETKSSSSSCIAENDDKNNYTSSFTHFSSSTTVLTINQYSDASCRNLLATVRFSGPGNQKQNQPVFSLKFDSVALTPVSTEIVNELNQRLPAGRSFCGQSWRSNVQATFSGLSGVTRQSCIGSIGGISGSAALVKKLVLSYMFSPPVRRAD